MPKKTERIEHGTSNVFADLGFADSVERKLRVQLTMQVNEAIQRSWRAEVYSTPTTPTPIF